MEITGDLSKDRALLESILRCSKWLEVKTAKLYKILSSRVVDEEAAALLRVIAYQSWSHARTMEALMKLFGIQDLEVPDGVCEELMKPVGPKTTKLIRRLIRVKKITPDQYDHLVKELDLIECGVGEEAYNRILLPLLKEVLKEFIGREVRGSKEWVMKSKIIDELVNDVVRQEKLHEFLVKKAQELLHHKKT